VNAPTTGPDHVAIAVLAVALVLLAAQLVLVRTEKKAARLVAKVALSGLFVAAAILERRADGAYFRLLVAGLALCVVGDLCLGLEGRRAFFAGLVAFLAGHVAYVAAFMSVARVGPAGLVGLLGAAAGAATTYSVLRPRLGSMRLPVAAYLVVISVMVGSASAVLGDAGEPIRGRVMVFAGAIAFALSDLLVARERFVAAGFVNRLVGLPLYYAGQFLLAFSAGVLG
jgi:uncharacterized membrane protein YhhN